MIMPCIKSTSAFESGVNVPFVDAGSCLLGWPGAPGCTTTGAAEFVCCARAGAGKRMLGAIAARSKAHSNVDIFVAERSLRLWRMLRGLHFGALLNILAALLLIQRSLAG